MTPGTVVLVVAVVGAVGFGIWRLFTDGRFRGTHVIRHAADGAGDGTTTGDVPQSRPDPVLANTEWSDQLGEKATLVQFSTVFCAPCRVARRTLGEVAAVVPGVVHLEIDAEHHLDLVRRLGIMRTPTTLVLDGEGHEVQRAAGAPTKEQVIAALGVAFAD
jgi:thiol-disulfide isomerase/thioredoxin